MRWNWTRLSRPGAACGITQPSSQVTETTQMRTHSWISTKCAVKPSRLAGQGVFCDSPLAQGELVAVWGGVVYSVEEIEALSAENSVFVKYPISITDGFVLGPIDGSRLDDAERFNHSCEPNAGVVGLLVLVARRDILAGEEVLFDYDTTETVAHAGGFTCRCESGRCRGLVDGSQWRNAAWRKAHAGFLSLHVQETIRRAAESSSDHHTGCPIPPTSGCI